MTDTKHTPEPWEISVSSVWGDTWDIGSLDDGRGIATVWGGARGKDVAQTNAVRIVACVNALAGLNPEAVQELVGAAEELMAWQAEREDEANGVQLIPDVEGQVFDALRAALANLKGAS